MAKKNKAAVELGRRGGRASARKLTVAQRKEKARKAAQAKWAKVNLERSFARGKGKDTPEIQSLTKREREIAEYAAQGRSNAFIAAHFRIGVNTVKKHIAHSMNKLGVSNRTELALRFAKSAPGMKRQPELYKEIIGFAILGATKEARDMAQYLLDRGQPTSQSERRHSE